MTARKATNRPRRASSLAANLPKALAEWFSGERAKPPIVSVCAAPFCAILPERWAAWKAAHPDARPPAGFEYLDDTKHLRNRFSTQQIEQGRKAAASWAGRF